MIKPVSTALQFSLQCFAKKAQKLEIGFSLGWRFGGGKGFPGAVETILK